MKKLNRKGFTLIELLAVIVILAIILVVTVPNIINSINDARVSSIHNLAVSVANTYDTAFAQDLVATTGNKLLGNIPESVDTTWKCIGSLSDTSTGGNGKTLGEILGLSENDVVLGGTGTSAPTITGAGVDADKDNIAATTCSAIRLYNGSAQVLLVARDGGKFYVAQKITSALSTTSAGWQKNK